MARKKSKKLTVRVAGVGMVKPRILKPPIPKVIPKIMFPRPPLRLNIPIPRQFRDIVFGGSKEDRAPDRIKI